MIFPAHLARAEHASLLHFEVLALTLFAAAAAAMRPTALRLSLVALAVLAAWLTSGYFGVMASIGAVVVAAAIAVFGKVEHRLRLIAGVFAAALTGTAVVGILSSISGTWRRRSIWYCRKGRSKIGTMGFGVCSVRGRSREPFPPDRSHSLR